jgi:hypothetical protein
VVGRRLGDREASFYVSAFAVRRELDIVPLLPPRKSGYWGFIDQRTPAGESFIENNLRGFWLRLLASKRLISHHRIEAYIADIFAALPPKARSTAFQPQHSNQRSDDHSKIPQCPTQAGRPSDLPIEHELE